MPKKEIFRAVGITKHYLIRRDTQITASEKRNDANVKQFEALILQIPQLARLSNLR